MSDPLSALVGGVWTGLAAHRGPGPARSAVATLLNAAGRAMWPHDRRVLEADTLTGDDERDLRVAPGCADLDGTRAGWWGVRLLVEAPPVSRAELAARLEGLPPAPVRTALAQLLESAPMPDPVVELITAAFEVVGGPGREAVALARVAADDTQPSQRREVAWRVLMDHDDVDLESVIDEVGADRIGELTRLGFAVGVRRIGSSTQLADELVDQVAPLDPPERRELVEMMEDAREMEGIPAAALYRPLLLSRAAPELDPIVVRALRRDGGPLAEDAIRGALAAESAPAAQQRLRRALLTVRTRRIEPPVDRAEDARAWVGLCDGQGDYTLVLATPNPREQYRVVSLSVRAGGDVRDGFVLDDLPADRLDAMLEQHDLTAELFEVSPAHAAAWLAVAVDRAPGGLLGLPDALQRSSDEVLRHAHHAVSHEPPDPDEGGRITLSACRALFRRPSLQEWVLDDRERALCGIPDAPTQASDFAEWVRRGARLARRQRRIRRRFAAMTRHLGEVLQLVGHPEARLAHRISRALLLGRGEPLLRVVLEQSAFVESPDEATAPLCFGDEGQREDIRRLLEPRAPAGEDLAMLDVIDCILSSELALVRTDTALADLRPDVRRAALMAAGEQLVRAMQVDDPAMEAVTASLSTAGLPIEAATRVAGRLRGLGERFRAEVCAGCPVGCWRAPEQLVGSLWAGPGHPAVVGQR